MLNDVYKDAIKNREQTRSILSDGKFRENIKRAKSDWIEYTPKKEESRIFGIDSSYNSTKFQGLEFWVVDAVSINVRSEISSKLYNYGLGIPKKELSLLAREQEIKVCNETIEHTDIVLMDGSLFSHFMSNEPDLNRYLINIIRKKNNVFFISKTSNSAKHFGAGIAGDIFYYNHATKHAGFCKIIEDEYYGKDKTVSTIYARLAESLPLLKIELLGKGHDNNEIKSILNRLYNNSVSGYPYSLKLAHKKCKISDRDLDKLVSLHSLTNEIGSREVLA